MKAMNNILYDTILNYLILFICNLQDNTCTKIKNTNYMSVGDDGRHVGGFLDLSIDDYIDGLVSAAALNGLAGRVLGFDAASGRYIIEIENGHGNTRIKSCDLLTEEDLDDAEGVGEMSGRGCHDDLNFSRIPAGGQSESLSADPACL